MTIRFARSEDLTRVNELRKQVNDLHVNGDPAVFREGFPDELRDYIYSAFGDPLRKIVVYEKNGEILAFAVLHHIHVPQTPYKNERVFLDIDEFGVDESHHRQGIATEMMRFIREYAKSEGFSRIELNMWEFNQGALEFYNSVGFRTYRRYMELKL